MTPQTVEAEFVHGLTQGGLRGLWVFGARKSGTTTLIKDLFEENKHAFPGVKEKRTAGWLEQRIHEQWKKEQLLKANGTDYALWTEANELEQRLDRFWRADVLWLDDLYTDYDITFVRKQMLLRMDEALKRGAVVLVSGTCPPDAFGADWMRAISQDYYIIDRAQNDLR